MWSSTTSWPPPSQTARISHLIEVACGLPPRGLTFSRRYGSRLTSVESDLPAMAATKARLLESIGALDDHHQVVELDAFADDGSTSLTTLAARLDHRGVARSSPKGW